MKIAIELSFLVRFWWCEMWVGHTPTPSPHLYLYRYCEKCKFHVWERG